MRLIQLISCIILSVLILGCEENFSPKLKFQEGYAMFGVVRYDAYASDLSFTVYLTKYYNVEGTNPDINNIDPSVKGAEVTYTHNRKVYTALETEMPNPDTLRYDSTITCYRIYASRVSPLDSLYLHATTPDDKTLRAAIQLPAGINIEPNYDYVRGFTTLLNDYLTENKLKYTWEKETDILYFPKLVASYLVDENNTNRTYTIEIPTAYINENGREIPYSPEYIYNSSIEYGYSIINKTLTNIGNLHPDADNIYLSKLNFTLQVFDEHLSKYYSSTNGYLDAFSIRLDERIYSNISGGTGLFGAYYSTDYPMSFDAAYCGYLGYKKK